MNCDFVHQCDCVIVCNGQFPMTEIPLSILRAAKTIICCDGAIEKLLAFGREPSVIVGDFDSISDKILARFSDRIFHDPNQEYNDLTKAIMWAEGHACKKIIILGATGLREDHSIANISLLCDYAEKGIDVQMVSDFGVFTPCLHSTEFSSFRGQQVSVFSLIPECEIISKNLRYPIKKALPLWWMGSLNEAEGDSFTLSFKKGKVIVYQSFQADDHFQCFGKK